MSHELIYQYIWSDKTEGGALRLSLVISYLPQYFPILCSMVYPTKSRQYITTYFRTQPG